MKISLTFDNIGSLRDEIVAKFLKLLIDETLDFLNYLDSLDEEVE